jgi:hypothetical protein
VVSAVLLPFYVLNGSLLMLNLSGAKFGLFALTYVRDILARLLLKEGCGFAVALFALGTFGYFQTIEGKTTRVALIRIYLVTSLVLAIVGTAAAGGGVNHYFEPALAMGILVPGGVARLQAAWQTYSPLAAFAMMMMLALLLPSLDAQRSRMMSSRPEDLRIFLKLVENRRVFTDDPYLAARISRPQAIDLSSLTNTEKRGGWAAWSSAQIAQELRQKKYEIVVLRTPMRSPYFPYNPALRYPRTHRLDFAIQTAITKNYNLCLESGTSDEYGQLYLYCPLSTNQTSFIETCPSLKQTILHSSARAVRSTK